MKNAHLRFGWLTYVKVTDKTTTNIKLRLDRFIGELLPDPPRQAKAQHDHARDGEAGGAHERGRNAAHRDVDGQIGRSPKQIHQPEINGQRIP